jgi:excisionase family DNA binding protein
MDYSLKIHRAALPEIMLVSDLAAALGLSQAAVRRAIHRGELGPWCRIGRRIAVRREALLEALEARETTPVPTPRTGGAIR